MGHGCFLMAGVERTFPDGLIIPMDETGAELCHSVVSRNAQEQVTWVHSYVSEDKQKTYCIYDGPPQKLSDRPHGEVTFR
jgi:hypothetical protein